MYSYLLCGFSVSKNSSLVINGFLTTSRLALTFSFCFMPTSVDLSALAGIDLINWRCLAGMLNTCTWVRSNG